MNDYIETTADTRGGKPRIRGSRITVSDIVLMHRKMGRALEEIAGSYDLALASVYAACRIITITSQRSSRVWTRKKR